MDKWKYQQKILWHIIIEENYVTEEDLKAYNLTTLNIEENNLSKDFLSGNVYGILSGVNEVLCEWWSTTGKDIPTFLKDEKLDDVLTEEQFIEAVTGVQIFSLLDAIIQSKTNR